jgi:hypothetical protein
MRLVQNILLLIGALALGAVSLCLLVGFLAYLVIRPGPGEGGFGGLGVIVAGVFCGAPIGALLGLVGAVRWMAQHERRSWSPVVWVGISLGFLVGLGASFRSLDRFFEAVLKPMNHMGPWLSALFVAAACSTVGGFLATMAVPRSHPTDKAR